MVTRKNTSREKYWYFVS